MPLSQKRTNLLSSRSMPQDQELEDGFGGIASEDDYSEEIETDDNATVLLAGFDSDADDDQEDDAFNLSVAPTVASDKKVRKKLKKIKA